MIRARIELDEDIEVGWGRCWIIGKIILSNNHSKPVKITLSSEQKIKEVLKYGIKEKAFSTLNFILKPGEEKSYEILADCTGRPETEAPRVMDEYDGFIVIEERNDKKKKTRKIPILVNIY